MENFNKGKQEQGEQLPIKKYKPMDLLKEQHKQEQAPDQSTSRISEESKEKKRDMFDLIFEIEQRNKDISKKTSEKRENQIRHISEKASLYYGAQADFPKNFLKNITKIRNISSRIHSHENLLISHETNGMIFKHVLKKYSIFDAYYDRYINPPKQKISDLRSEYEEVHLQLQKQLPLQSNRPDTPNAD